VYNFTFHSEYRTANNFFRKLKHKYLDGEGKKPVSSQIGLSETKNLDLLEVNIYENPGSLKQKMNRSKDF